MIASTGREHALDRLSFYPLSLRENEEVPMKKISIYTTVYFVLSVWVLPGTAVTWGEPDAEHTNVGAMVTDSGQFPPFLAWCSGILIHPRVFLTAGHCTDAEELEEAEVRTVCVSFDRKTSNKSTLLAVEQVITHPDYDGGPQSNPHDVGVLILAKRIDDIKPAILPKEGLLDALKANHELEPQR